VFKAGRRRVARPALVFSVPVIEAFDPAGNRIRAAMACHPSRKAVLHHRL